MEYVLSMGTNIGDRKQNIEKAIGGALIDEKN